MNKEARSFDTTLAEAVRVLYTQGKKHYDDNECQLAKSKIEQVLALVPKDVESLTLYAEILLNLNNPLSAIRYCNNALQMDPNNSALLLLRDKINASMLPGIFVNTLPKSGSVYIFKHIQKCLGISFVRISLNLFSNDLAVPSWVEKFAEGHAVTQQHLPALRRNLITLRNNGVTRFIVHARDPRQSLLSWFHHLETYESKFNDNVFDMDDTPLCLNYFELSEAKKIDWLIENYHPLQVKWLMDWVNVSEMKNGAFTILFTRFEDLKKDPEAFFEKIIDFYQIDPSSWSKVEYQTKRGSHHFRKGMIDEWRTVMSSDQQEKVTELIPDKLLNFFNWKR